MIHTDLSKLNLQQLHALKHQLAGPALERVLTLIEQKAAELRAAEPQIQSQNRPTPSERRKPRDLEHQVQAEVIAKVDGELVHKYPELRWLFAVPNGGDRNLFVAKKMKAEGVRRGVCDLWLPVRRAGYVGWVREMKAEAERADGAGVERRRPTPDQEDWLMHLESEGWDTGICYTAAETLRELVMYLDQPKGEKP